MTNTRLPIWCNSNVCSFSHCLEDFCKLQKKYQTDLENEGQDQVVVERDLRRSTGNARIHIGDLFQNFSYMGICVYAKINTHIHMPHTHPHARAHARTHTHSQTHTHTHTHSHTHTHIHTHTHKHRHACTHAHTHTYSETQGDDYSQNLQSRFA